MKAIVCRELGPPSVLTLEELPSPALMPGGVRVRVKAAALNFPDVLMVAGGYQLKPDLPFVPGMEGCGEVIEAADDVTDLVPGDRVIVRMRPGAFAEEVTLLASRALPAPSNFSDVEAAGYMVGYATAYHCLLDRGALKPGEVALIHGSTGGVGLPAIDLARQAGATVIATGASDEKLAKAKELGADHLINVNDGFREKVLELTDGRGADVIYDPVGGDVFDESMRCIAWRGRLVVVGFAAGRIPELSVNRALLKGCSVVGARAGEFTRREPEAGRTMEQTLLQWAEEGRVRPHISHELPLERAVEAFELIRQRKVVGKAVLRMDRT